MQAPHHEFSIVVEAAPIHLSGIGRQRPDNGEKEKRHVSRPRALGFDRGLLARRIRTAWP